jgi:hypothetical protein
MAVDDDIDSLEAELQGLDDDTDDSRAKIVRFLPVILAVGALLVFSVVVIVAYGGDDDEVVVMNIQDIGPDTPAIKIEADSAGAPVPVEGQDNPAYNPMNQGTDDTQVAAITPPPEEPLDPAQPGVIKIPPPEAPVADAKDGQAAAPADAATADGGKPENLIADTGATAAEQPVDQQPPAADNRQKTKIPEPTTQTAQAGTAVAPQPKQNTIMSAPPAAGTGTTAFRTMAGVYRVQIASTKSEGLAQREWSEQVSKYPDVLSSLSLTVQRAVVKNRGTFYRVQGGPFPDRDAADSVCRKLKSRGQDCLVVRP